MERMIDPLAKKGMRIRMQMMDDERPISSGMEGVINHIDSLGTLHVKWDNGRTMGVVPEIDKYELLPPEEDQIGLDVFEDSAEKLMKKIQLPTIIEKLIALNANVSYSDQYVEQISDLENSNKPLKSKDISPKLLQSFDCVLLATDHDNFDYELIKKYSKLIIDTRGKFKKSKKIVQA